MASNVHVSMDSPNSYLIRVPFEQENAILKGILEKRFYKSVIGSQKFNGIWCKQGQHRRNESVCFIRRFKSNDDPWDTEQYHNSQFVPQNDKYDPPTF